MGSFVCGLGWGFLCVCLCVCQVFLFGFFEGKVFSHFLNVNIVLDNAFSYQGVRSGLSWVFFFKEKVEGGIKCKNFKTTADEKSVGYKAGVLFFVCVCVSFVCWPLFCVWFIYSFFHLWLTEYWI